METTISNSTGFSEKILLRKALLVCGVLASVLYIATDLLAVMRWDEYSYASQTVSELIAIDAPTRPLVVPLFTVYALLVYAFGVGVWRLSGSRLTLKLVAIGLVGKEVLGLVVTLFAPMHLRGVETTLSDSMHGSLTFIGVLFILLAIGSGAMAFGKWFRIYSIATIPLLIVFGVLAGLDAPRLETNLPTPWMGVYERINIYSFMLWVVVLSIVLLRVGKFPDERKGNNAKAKN
jgi:Protein of unknown function (DUF998)